MSSVAMPLMRLAARRDVALGADHAANGAQGGGLARAIGAQQRGHAAFVDQEVDAVQDRVSPYAGVQALGLKQRRHASCVSPR